MDLCRVRSCNYVNCIHNEYKKPDLNPAVKFKLFVPKEGNVLAVPSPAGLALGSPTCFILEFIFRVV